MKRVALLMVVGSLALASCNRVIAPNLVSSSKAFTFTNQGAAGYASAAGDAKYADLTAGDRYTVLTVSGLKASTDYVAHYHAKGATAGPDCQSGGGVVGGMIGGTMVTSDASGKVVIKGLQATADLSTAAYINVHEAAALSVVPVCADI